MADPHCRSRNEGLGWQTLEWVSGDVAVGMSIPRKPRCMTKSGHLDPRLTSLLQSLRERIRRYVVWDSLLAVAAVVLAAFWLGLALDYLPVQLGGTEMPRLARSLLLLIVAAIVLAILIRMLIGRLSRPLPDDSLALLVERHHPKLGGRLVTAVQLNEPGRQGDSHSSLLLQEVHEQAAAAIDEVDPNRVFRREPLVRKAMIAGPLALCALVFLIISPQAFGRAASRLTLLSDEPWPRRAQLEMVGVELPVVSASDEQSDAPDLIEFNEKADSIASREQWHAADSRQSGGCGVTGVVHGLLPHRFRYSRSIQHAARRSDRGGLSILCARRSAAERIERIVLAGRAGTR